MRSSLVVPNQPGLAQQFDTLRADASGAGSLLVHQQLGALALGTAPTNGQTVTVVINGTSIVLTAVGTIGTTPGNVLNPGTAAGFTANVAALLANPQTTTSTGVALSSPNQTLLSYVSWAVSGTTITPCSNNTSLYAPLTSFNATTTVTAGTYTAATLKLYVEPGVFYIGGTRVIFAGGSSPAVTAPVSNPRIDVLSINSSGTLAWTTGAENASPAAPTYPSPSTNLVLCELYNVVGETALYDNANQNAGQGFISNDVRSFQQPSMNWGVSGASLIPDADGTRNLGSPSFEWNNIYAKSGIFLNGVSINSQLTLSLTAAESIASKAAVSIAPYQSDGGVLFDAAQTGSVTASGTTATVAAPITVGSNANRILIVVAMSGASGVTATWNGTSLTQIDQQQQTSGGSWMNTYYLIAPATGAQNLVFNNVGSGTSMRYFIFSYYNAKQSGQPDAHTVAASTSPVSTSITPSADGSLLFGVVWNQDNGVSASGMPNNQKTGNGWTGATTQGMIAGDAGQIFPKLSQTITGTQTSGSGSRIISTAITIAPFTAPSYDYVFNASSAAANQRSSGFNGFALNAVSVGQQVTVAIAGYVSGLAGLTPLAQYYLNDSNGTIGVSPGTVTRKVGIALSTTELIITNIW